MLFGGRVGGGLLWRKGGVVIAIVIGGGSMGVFFRDADARVGDCVHAAVALKGGLHLFNLREV